MKRISGLVNVCFRFPAVLLGYIIPFFLRVVYAVVYVVYVIICLINKVFGLIGMIATFLFFVKEEFGDASGTGTLRSLMAFISDGTIFTKPGLATIGMSVIAGLVCCFVSWGIATLIQYAKISLAFKIGVIPDAIRHREELLDEALANARYGSVEKRDAKEMERYKKSEGYVSRS